MVSGERYSDIHSKDLRGWGRCLVLSCCLYLTPKHWSDRDQKLTGPEVYVKILFSVDSKVYLESNLSEFSDTNRKKVGLLK